MKQIASGVNVAPTKVQEKIDVAKLHAARVGGIFEVSWYSRL